VFVHRDLTTLPSDRLEREIAGLAGDINVRMEHWLALIAEFDRRQAAPDWGFRGTAEWLSWRCAIGPRAARDHVRVARRLAELPLVRDAFAGGELSYSKVRALARTSEIEDEAGLVELARASTACELERAVRQLRTAESADVNAANRSHERRFLGWWWDPDGSLRFHGRLAPDEGAALIEAIDTAAEALHGLPSRARSDVADADARRPARGARRVDALTEILISGAPRAQVVLHVDAEALACESPGPVERAGALCALEDAPAVPSETARRLACDADLVVARARGDGPADFGRSRRVVSPAMRASLERRDGHCRFPGCVRRHGLHAHHVRHWVHGGRTDHDNLVLLCRFHHRLVHEGGFSLRHERGALSFRRPDGRTVQRLPEPPGTAGRAPPGLAVAA